MDVGNSQNSDDFSAFIQSLSEMPSTHKDNTPISGNGSNDETVNTTDSINEGESTIEEDSTEALIARCEQLIQRHQEDIGRYITSNTDTVAMIVDEDVVTPTVPIQNTNATEPANTVTQNTNVTEPANIIIENVNATEPANIIIQNVNATEPANIVIDDDDNSDDDDVVYIGSEQIGVPIVDLCNSICDDEFRPVPPRQTVRSNQVDVRPVIENDEPQMGKKCVICMDDAFSNEPTATICGHIFCATCIRTALKVCSKCPVCNKKINVKQIHRLYL